MASPYASNMEIFGEGEPAEYLYEVVRGLVCRYKILSDGRRQIVAFHMPGDVFGLEVDECHCFSAEAVNNATLLAVKRSMVMGLALALWMTIDLDYPGIGLIGVSNLPVVETLRSRRVTAIKMSDPVRSFE